MTPPNAGPHAGGAASNGDEPAPVTAIEFRDIWTSFGDRQILKGVSFSVPKGQVTAVLGASGVGKTTLVRHLLALHRPDSGQVLVEGRDVNMMRDRDRQAMLKRFGVVLQGSGVFGSALWGSMSVLDNVVHQLHTLCPKLSEREVYQRSVDRLREVGVAEHMADLPDILSAGQQKRVALARALASEPEFAILDSFDMGIDGVRLAGVREIIRRQHGMWGGTYLLVTHNVALVHSLATHVVVLHEGRVVQEGPTEEVFASEHPAVTQLLTGAIDGPLLMGDGGVARNARRNRDQVDIQAEWVPLPIATAVILAAITLGTIVLGQSLGKWVYYPVGACWVIAISFLGWFYYGPGSDWANRHEREKRAEAFEQLDL
ncbi:MAG TPA: ATP-binding cassette domain-containing protein [Solirubrobacteraceae bacterium]|nr:ATP-binding cassette domain-containing protein [Solirubrobacteraceae bacterium]